MPQVQQIGRPQGGVIGKENVTSFQRASGLWRVGEVFQARGQEEWPVRIGSPFLGGFFAGIMDTTQSGAIIGADQYQTPLRYALIVSPRSLQAALPWRTTTDTVVEAQTRWNGLAAQEALMPDSDFPAFDYCHSLSFPNDGASRWYLPALDELTEAYWNLKPTTDDNTTGTRLTGPSSFPFENFEFGELFSSDPQRPPFTSGTPEQTDVDVFKSGGGQELLQIDGTFVSFWCASWRSDLFAYRVFFDSGNQIFTQQFNGQLVRPFRRFILPS